MLKKDPKYRRLKIGGRGMFATREYWLGPDHLLMIEVSSYTERYRRFYFRDAQGLIIQETAIKLWANIFWCILGTLSLAWLIWGMVEETHSGWKDTGGLIAVILLGTVSALFLLGLLDNNLRGPTCTVLLRTAVQTQKLSNIVRWKKAERLAIELAPLIQAAQAAYVTPPAAAETAAPITPAPAAPMELPPEAPPPPAA